MDQHNLTVTVPHNFTIIVSQNFSWILNASNRIDPDLMDLLARNRSLDDPAFYSLIAVYTILIALGAAGNSLVVCAVVRKPGMRTARNMFIVNLAVSDLLLCLITMPLTLMEILTRYWPLGRHPFTCKMLGTLQATSIFVSTISITAIALDRYHVIVYPTRESLQKLGAVVILSCIWLFSLVLASPMFIWKTLVDHDINLPLYGIDYIAYCLEEWPIEHGRAYYSLFSLVFQYVLPIITVSVAYSRICRKLRYRYANSGKTIGSSQKRKHKDDVRMKRTNSLLISIAVIFCVSWLPLNIFNLVVDFYNPFGEDRQAMMVCYAVCHMIGMSSACSNPLLYGWLNDNFRKEFKEILACVTFGAAGERAKSFRSSLSRRRRKRGDSAGSGEDTALREMGSKANKKEVEETVLGSYRRVNDNITNSNGLQTDTETTVLSKV